MRPALILIALFAVFLAACGDSGQTGGVERKSAAGEVLGGEVSDAMLPLDSVKSTSPVEPPRLSGTDKSGGGTTTQPTPTPGKSTTPDPREQAPDADDAPQPSPPPQP